MDNCILAFEYSDIEADIHSHIDSIKNVLNGKILVDSYGEYIRNRGKIYPSELNGERLSGDGGNTFCSMEFYILMYLKI